MISPALRAPQTAAQAAPDEQLEALTNASEHLRFAKQVIETAELPAELHQGLQQQIQHIEQRLVSIVYG